MIRNNRGQSILESLVGLGLIVVVGFAFVGGIVALRKTTKGTVTLSATERQISDIAENIKAGVENYQINYNYRADIDQLLNYKALPMSWDIGVAVPRAQCTECQGTFGYVIVPYEKFRGLYKVTLRMTHKSWLEPYRDYVFVVSAK
ncbi:hypothetical protein D3C87_1395080 [compost metagenome]